MKAFKGYFDELGFWDSATFGKPIITDTSLIIPTRNIEIYPGHPLNQTDKPIVLAEGQLIFSGVRKSDRIVYEYLGDPKSGAGFKPEYKIADFDSETIDDLVETYVLEGVLEEPLAWITWEIESGSFCLEVGSSAENETIGGRV